LYNSPPRQAEELGTEVVYPYVESVWEEHSERLSHLSRIYLLIGNCYRERGGEERNEREREFFEKALVTAIESGDAAACANASRGCAYMEIKRGDVKKAHEYLYRAIEYYDLAENYVRSSEMLYVIASNFFETKDIEGLRRVLGQMEEYLQEDTSKQSLYQYNVIKHFYYDMMLDRQKADGVPPDHRLVDSSLIYIRSNVDIVENHLAELAPEWMHGYAYYFLAKELDAYYPAQTDSIFHYLDRALEMLEMEHVSRLNEANAEMELRIYEGTVRAKALFREGRMGESRAAMDRALALGDQLQNYDNLNVARYDLYAFAVEYYERNGPAGQALRYQKLLTGNEARRFEKEKVQAINDMAARYETEKKELRILSLVEQNRAARRILWLIAGLSAALLAGLLLVVLYGRQRRKNFKQWLYEAALIAELHNNESQQLHERGQREQDPVSHVIEKMARAVAESPIEKSVKKRYAESIAAMDSKILEQAYRTSTAKLTGMDLKYMICFLAGMDVRDISLLMNVEPASVHTVRYRIRKKFPHEESLRAVLQGK
jgi:hypothetical protein